MAGLPQTGRTKTSSTRPRWSTKQHRRRHCTALGFDHVSNLKGGMLDWNESGPPVER
jgi:hypothetical protein